MHFVISSIPVLYKLMSGVSTVLQDVSRKGVYPPAPAQEQTNSRPCKDAPPPPTVLKLLVTACLPWLLCSSFKVLPPLV